LQIAQVYESAPQPQLDHESATLAFLSRSLIKKPAIWHTAVKDEIDEPKKHDLIIKALINDSSMFKKDKRRYKSQVLSSCYINIFMYITSPVSKILEKAFLSTGKSLLK
jgi:hypothetical protein